MKKNNIKYIKENTSIIDYCKKLNMDLEKIGNKYKSKCPFHSEDTASFFLYPDTNSFHCFGCKTGGDVIDFIQKYYNLSKYETIKKIIQDLGNNNLNKREYKPIKEKRKLKTKNINKSLSMTIYEDLIQYVNLTEAGKNYLIKRAFSFEVIKEMNFKSIDKNFKLFNHLKKKWGIDNLKNSGIIGRSKTGNNYLIFFNCIIIPHYDNNGKINYLLGKPYNGKPKEIKPKGIKQKYFYLNLKPKRQYIFESVFDAISFYSLTGKNNIISTAGINQIDVNKLKKQLEAITNQKKEIVLALDNDKAGRNTIKEQSKSNNFKIINVDDVAKEINLGKTVKDWNELLQYNKLKKNNAF